MQHADSAALWIDAVEIEVRDGIAFAHLKSAGREFELRASIATLAAAMESMASAYAGHMACQRAQIVKLSERGPLFLKEGRTG